MDLNDSDGLDEHDIQEDSDSMEEQDADKDSNGLDQDAIENSNGIEQERQDTDSEMRLDIKEDPDGMLHIGGVDISPPIEPMLTTEETKPRLIITDMYMKNFKSYAGEQRLGPLDKNFTSVVGPNGSGKSNIIDALLFVFGYRAQKIRSKKISVLIHKSDNFQEIQSCRVKVCFAVVTQGEGCNIVPGSEFNISRTAFVDNTSYYEVNGKRKQFQEVNKLLRIHGIDLDYSRFLILQGEIEQISLMKPKGVSENDIGMLEYLEDIVGSNRFIKHIENFSKKIDELSDIRIEKLNELKLVEKEKDGLEEAKNKAMEYLNLENEKITAESTLMQIKLKNATEELQCAILEQNAIMAETTALETQQNELEEQKKTKEMHHNKISKEHEVCAKQCEEYIAQFNKFECEDLEFKEKWKFSKENIKKLSKSLDSEEEKIQQLKKKAETAVGEATELEIKKENFQTQLKTAEEKLDEVMELLKHENQDLVDERDIHEAELMEVQKAVLPAKSAMELAEAELQMCLSVEEKEKKALEDLVKEYDNSVAAINEDERLLKAAEAKVVETESKLSSSKEKLIEVERKEQLLSEEVRSKRNLVEEAKSSLNSFQHRNAILKELLHLKTSGVLPGVYGRLGDLGAIDEKYDVAISTACGRLDNIVTDTLATAQACVQVLKTQNLGYATFIALDKIKKWDGQKISTPESVPRLVDLVRVQNEAVQSAFYFSLGDTLVAADLDQATRIGLQGSVRRRVVTLRGDLIDASGTMSGGGTKVSKGRIGQSIQLHDTNPKDIERMAAELESLSSTLSELKKHKLSLEEHITKTANELVQLQHSMKKTAMHQDSLQERLKMLATQKENQVKKVKSIVPDRNKITELELQIAKHKKAYSKAADVASVVEDKVKKLKEKLSAKTKSTLKPLQSRVDKLTAELDEISKAISKSTVNKRTWEKNLKKSEQKVVKWEQELNELNDMCSNIKEEMSLLTEKGRKALQLKSDATEKMQQLEEAKKAIVKDLTLMKDVTSKNKRELIELKNNKKTIDSKVKEKEKIIMTWSAKFTDLKLNPIDGTTPEATVYSFEELSKMCANELSKKIGNIQGRLSSMKVDFSSIKQYQKLVKVVEEKLQEVETVYKEQKLNRLYYEELRRRRMDEFLKGFNIISRQLKEIYRLLTLEGDAEFEIIDSLDPFSEGIGLSVRPPKKSWKNISNLSGGEKTLSSLALVFALHYYRPTPFYVMDEIDAALDYRNVAIVAYYVHKQAKNTQFLIVSLRNNMYKLSDHLIGIFKQNNCTRNIILTDVSKRLLLLKSRKEKASEGQVSSSGIDECATSLNGMAQNDSFVQALNALE